MYFRSGYFGAKYFAANYFGATGEVQEEQPRSPGLLRGVPSRARRDREEEEARKLLAKRRQQARETVTLTELIKEQEAEKIVLAADQALLAKAPPTTEVENPLDRELIERLRAMQEQDLALKARQLQLQQEDIEFLLLVLADE